MGRPQNIRERVFSYSLRAIKLYQVLLKQKDGVSLIIGKQYLRSATSIGANLEEAYAAESRRDFIHKYRIALKEGHESLYWLRLLVGAELVAQTQMAPLVTETNEIVSILTTIIKKTMTKESPPS